MRYPLLNNKEWLEQKYLNEQLSTIEIAEIIGCHKTSVSKSLNKFNIQTRTNSECHLILPAKKSKYKLLNNKKWLKTKYIDEKLSTKKIAKLVGAKTCNSVRQHLIKFDIPVRNISDGLTICNDDGFIWNSKSEQIIEGGLLGDAYMSSYNPKSDYSYPVFRRKNKHKKHIEWVAYALGGQKMVDRIFSESRTFRNKSFEYFVFQTFCHKELLEIYRRWYQYKNGKLTKIVPVDLKLTPITLLHWFLDDGSTSWRKDRVKQVRLIFCSESFTKAENEFLCEQIKGFGLRSTIKKCPSGTGWRIGIGQSSVADFFDLIGSCPVESMRYKWKVPK